MITQALYVNEQLGTVETPAGTLNIYSIDNPLYTKDIDSITDLSGISVSIVTGTELDEAAVVKFDRIGDDLNASSGGTNYAIMSGQNLLKMGTAAQLDPDRLYLTMITPGPGNE